MSTRQFTSATRTCGARLTHARHARDVHGEAVEAVARVALRDAHAAAVLTAVQDPALVRLQTLEGAVLAALRRLLVVTHVGEML